MNMKIDTKSGVRIAFLVFMIVTFVIVFSHSFLEGFGLHFEYTISRYVGLTYWSAILFLICNLNLGGLIFRFLREIMAKWKMSKVWWICAVFMILMLILLSCCPVGLFDENWGDFGVVSLIHRFSSKAMFVAALFTAFETIVKFRKSRTVKIAGILFIFYGLFCVGSVLSDFSVFNQYILFFEWGFLVFYLVFLLMIPEFSKKNKELDD